MDSLTQLIKENLSFYQDNNPLLFNLQKSTDKEYFDKILVDNKPVVFDDFLNQTHDLIKNQNPSKKLSDAEISKILKDKYPNKDLKTVGIWVYYPWNNSMVHILDEDDFVELRTVRNKYKITQEEQDLLATKKIGVIGLSVGQSVSLSLSMERSYGELKLADYDTLELSNYNRIRTPLTNLGLLKTTTVKREILEIDPYLKVSTFENGLEEGKIEDFIRDLDIVVDEMDNLFLKVKLRIAARKLKIPVISEMSDRGMIDIERFDIDPSRELFHGRIKDSELIQISPENASSLIFKILSIDSVSERMKSSFFEIGKTITSWPQLGADVAFGGGRCATIIREILLSQQSSSGRFYTY